MILVYLSGPNIDSIITLFPSDLDTISNWFLHNKLTINTQKSFVVVIESSQKLSNIVKPFPSLVLNKATLEYRSSAKYLGITIYSTLSWKEHIVDSYKIYPRTRNFDKLQLPQVRTETAHNSFHFQGPTLWNSLPSHICLISDLQTFKNLLKTYYLNYSRTLNQARTNMPYPYLYHYLYNIIAYHLFFSLYVSVL